ncbi:MAG: family 20 glycosylhydrolase, partial [Bacteroidaceae bacterium]|nr:family 20 glycosylhydrolase [Bacteroidaceae bacterium]
LHGNTAALGNATIMAWIGADDAAKEAARRGFDAILTPQIPYYINRKQSADPAEPLSQGHGTESLEAVYNYAPAKGVSPDLQARYLGVQANFWTEWVEEAWHLEYLLLPRLAAVAEAGWTPQEHRHYPDFLHRLTPDRELYFLRGYAYGRHAWGDNP